MKFCLQEDGRNLRANTQQTTGAQRKHLKAGASSPGRDMCYADLSEKSLKFAHSLHDHYSSQSQSFRNHFFPSYFMVHKIWTWYGPNVFTI